MRKVWENVKQLKGQAKDAYLLAILKVYGDQKGVVQRVLHESDPNSKAADAATDTLAEFKIRDPAELSALGTELY